MLFLQKDNSYIMSYIITDVGLPQTVVPLFDRNYPV